MRLYIKKPISNFRDLKWLEDEILLHNGTEIKFNLDKKYIDKFLEVIKISKWKYNSVKNIFKLEDNKLIKFII